MSDLRIKIIQAKVVFLSTTTVIGTLPAGCRMTAIKALNVEANDAGTSAAIEIGITGAVAKYETGIDVKTAAGDIAVTMLTPVVPTADEIIIATLTEAGSTATAGSCTIVIEYTQTN